MANADAVVTYVGFTLDIQDTVFIPGTISGFISFVKIRHSLGQKLEGGSEIEQSLFPALN